jgi:hypothetical protein
MPSASCNVADAVGVVVLNWNGADDTLACLKSLRASTVPLQVVVVDNGSRDDSVARINGSGLADEVIETHCNLGFAEGNNRGIRAAIGWRCHTVVVLNNDTVVEPSALKELVKALPPGELKAVSPDIRYYAAPEVSWFFGGTIERGWPRHLQAHERDRASGTQTLTGCCIAARRETWEYVGLFDPKYFLIFEDSDWSVRASVHGVRLEVVAASRILHRVSRSFEGDASLLVSYYFVRNGMRFQWRYFRKHLPRFAVRWLLTPAPSLLRAGRQEELLFRFLGALAFCTGRSGGAGPMTTRLALRLVRR